LLLISGPNGAGKSTVAPALIREVLGGAPFVNADVIARGIAGKRADEAAFEAGRLAIERIRELITAKQDFAFESTLASRSLARWLGDAKGRGYTVFLAYVWVPRAEVSIDRVARRVASGGHNVPEEVIRRRYERSLENLRSLYLPLADLWRVYDHTEAGRPALVATGSGAGDPDVHDADAWRRVTGTMGLRESPVAYEVGTENVEARLLDAMRIATGHALLKHKLLRQSIVTYDLEGNIFHVPPDEIDTGLSPEEEEEAIATAGHGTWFSQ
jgi:predicted ABC-type ATPase